MSASEPASGLPVECIALFLLLSCRGGVEGAWDPVRGLLDGGSGSLWTGDSGMSSISPRMVVVIMTGLWSGEKDVDIANLHSGVSGPFHTRWSWELA